LGQLVYAYALAKILVEQQTSLKNHARSITPMKDKGVFNIEKIRRLGNKIGKYLINHARGHRNYNRVSEWKSSKEAIKLRTMKRL